MKKIILLITLSMFLITGCNNNYGWLYREVNYGNLQEVQEALASIKDEGVLQEFKVRVFWAACEFDHVDIAKYVLDQGGIIIDNPRVYNGPTPLHMVIQHDNIEVMALLLKNGADANQQTSEFHTPFMWAIRMGKREFAEMLLNYNADINKVSNDMSALHIAAASDNSDMLKFLIDKGADVNIDSGFGCRPLHIAAWCNKIENAKILLEYGADPTLKCNGYTLMQLAKSDEFKKYIQKYHMAKYE